MKTITSIFFAMLLLTIVDNAQQLTFQKTVGGTAFEYGYALQKTLDGGYAVGASTSSYGAASVYFWVIKYDVNGNMMWNKIYENTDNGGTRAEPINDIYQTSDGGYIVGGYTRNINPPQETDALIIKTDKNGDTLWTKYWGGSTSGGTFSDCYLVTQASDGNVLAGGYTTAYGDGGEDAFLLKLDVNTGDTLWTRVWGGTQNEWLYHMQQTNDGGIILSGLTSSFGTGTVNILLIKTDAAGNIQWAKAYGSPGLSQYGFGHCLQQTSDNGYIITGVGGFILKTDLTGVIQWQKKINFDSAFTGHAVEQTTDGGYIVGGHTGITFEKACLIKTNDTGKVIWSYFYGGSGDDICWAVGQADDGGYFMSGQTSSFGTETFGDPDAYIVKTDSNGISGCNQTAAGAYTSNSNYTSVNAPLVVHYGPQTKHPHISILTGYSEDALCYTPTGINEIEKTNSSVILYPNPNNGRFIVTGVKQGQVVEVYNYLGQKLSSLVVINSSMNFDISSQPNGVYLVRILNKNGSLATQKKILKIE